MCSSSLTALVWGKVEGARSKGRPHVCGSLQASGHQSARAHPGLVYLQDSLPHPSQKAKDLLKEFLESSMAGGQYTAIVHACYIASVVSDSLRPHGLGTATWSFLCRRPTSLLCPWDSPGKNTGVGGRFLLQGIFPTQGSNPHLLCLLHWQEGPLGQVLPNGQSDSRLV